MKKNRSEQDNDLMDKVISLCKRRGFIFPGSAIYGGIKNSWDYGPLGAELKKNIKDEWWNRFVRQRTDMVGIDAALIMNPKVWEASGHLATFTDPLVECKKCHNRFRADENGKSQIASTKSQTNSKLQCPNCGSPELTEAKQFNLMLKTHLGPTEDKASEVYFRPEIAQAMFVNFKNVMDTTRKRLPFGIASQGSAFRNEITPGNFIFRTREFDLMEFEYFINPKDWEKTFEHWLGEMKRWLKDLGVNEKHLHYVEVSKEDRAHYSQRTVDIEYDYPFGQKELYGIAYRGDFDLSNHAKASGADLSYTDPEDQKNKFIPHVIEPSFGLNRSMLVALLEAYTEEEVRSKNQESSGKPGKRVYLKLPYWLAPYKVAVFPLLANKPALVAKAREVYTQLINSSTHQLTPVAFDDRGNVGKRYYSQDEIGTPFCVTIDFDTLGETPALADTVTVRDRDTMKQERVKIVELKNYLQIKLAV